MHLNTQKEDGKNYEHIETQWQSAKETLLGEETTYKGLKEDLMGYIEKEGDLNGWLRKAEDVCREMEDIERVENAEEVFETFTVSTLHHRLKAENLEYFPPM